MYEKKRQKKWKECSTSGSTRSVKAATHAVFGKHLANHMWSEQRAWLAWYSSFSRKAVFSTNQSEQMFGKLLLRKCMTHAAYVYHCVRYSANSSTNLYNYLMFAKYHMLIAPLSEKVYAIAVQTSTTIWCLPNVTCV